MPRVGLTPDAVVDAALELVDEQGMAGVTLAAVADSVGVRTPSLYKHVDSLADLERRLAARALDELVASMEVAVGDADGADALRRLMNAYRDWSRAHPQRHALIPVTAPEPGTLAGTASDRFVAVVTRWIAGEGWSQDDAVHAIRLARSALHGFCSIEAAGGFGLPVDVEATWERLVRLVADGLRTQLP